MKKFDVLIIGSGMGGLICGNILGREGYTVCIVEKNKQIGGCLQIYTRNRIVFDSGVHYLGGMDKGQNLYQIFKWLGLTDKLRLEKMDAGFDRILIGADQKEYQIVQGFRNFEKQMCTDFPDEKAAIRKYLETIEFTCDQFPMYRLRTNDYLNSRGSVMGISAKLFIESLTENKKLRAVLAGNNMLYAGAGEETPFYVHALTVNSYMESSWRCADSGMQIGNLLMQNITSNNGIVIRNREVKKIIIEKERASKVILQDGSSLSADYIVSNTTPANTFDMIDSKMIRQATRTRVHELKTTISSFIVNAVFKSGEFRYRKCNYYWHESDAVWEMDVYNNENWPRGYALYFTPSRSNPEFASGLTIFAYMKYEEVAAWSSSFNTVSAKHHRGQEYEEFKTRKAEKLFKRVEERFPDLRKQILHYYTATPLTYRDYIGNGDGNLYGSVKDYRDPLRTLISPKTKIPNLFLTGQSLNLHGILGTTISGMLTAASLLNNNGFIEKIRNA
jgi:all-trans-retinol 13,14-reductase